MDATTTPNGVWAPQYGERLHLIRDIVDLNQDFPDPEADKTFWAWIAPFGEPESASVRVEDRSVTGPHGPIRVRVYRPAEGRTSGVGLVWLHGGAFLGGDLDMPEADQVARGLVDRTRGVVVSVFYRLCVNGVHHPEPHDDAYAAYRWTVANAASLGIDPGRVAVGGASAGGCLAGTVAIHGRDDGLVPSIVILAYPVAHAVIPEVPELIPLQAQMPPLLRFLPDAVAAMNTNYVGGDPEQADGYAFPGHADDLHGLPPVYIENCEFDDLRPSGELFGRQLADAGVDVEVMTAAGVPHGHLNAVGSPLTAASLDRIAARLVAH